MTSLYIFIGIITFFFLALIISNSIHRKKGNTQVRETRAPEIDVRTKQEKERDSGCCGLHEVCEKDSLISAFTEKAEYFDDEELDRFKFRDGDSYSSAEVEEFREVFYSVLDEEKPRWVRSMQTRNIQIPNQMKDEIVMIVNDLREQKMYPSHA